MQSAAIELRSDQRQRNVRLGDRCGDGLRVELTAFDTARVDEGLKPSETECVAKTVGHKQGVHVLIRDEHLHADAPPSRRVRVGGTMPRGPEFERSSHRCHVHVYDLRALDRTPHRMHRVQWNTRLKSSAAAAAVIVVSPLTYAVSGVSHLRDVRRETADGRSDRGHHRRLRAFAAKQQGRLLARGIDIVPYGLSHLAYRVADRDQYVHVRRL